MRWKARQEENTLFVSVLRLTKCMALFNQSEKLTHVNWGRQAQLDPNRNRRWLMKGGFAAPYGTRIVQERLGIPQHVVDTRWVSSSTRGNVYGPAENPWDRL